MDDADLTAERMEREAELRQRERRAPAGPEPKGTCYFCDERLPSPMRWCDAECRDGWSFLKKLGRA